MKFYISTKGIKRVTISKKGSAAGTTAAAAASRRISIKTVLPLVVVLGIVLPFVFVRVAFLVLESATVCSSSVDCIGWRFLGGTDTSAKLREELTRALLEAKESNINEKSGANFGNSMQSFNELVKEMMSSRQDIKAFAFKTKAMLLQMERKIQSAKLRESFYWHFASLGVPKSSYCFCLKLAEEYAVNAIARSPLPQPEYVSRLTDPSLNHIVLLTDNVIAASVVVSSAIQASLDPEKLVFHIITDKKTYAPMHAWFSINSIKSAVVEVKGLHQYDWSQEVNVEVKEMLETHRLIWEHQYNNLKEEFEIERLNLGRIEALAPSCFSLMNHIRIYIPELFPDLNKIVFLDDDTVVQDDLSALWDLDLKGKVLGAVINSWCGDNCCPGRKYKDFLNFSHPVISSKFDGDRCSWLYGMNIFDLEAWRRTNITAVYHRWLKLCIKSGLTLWHPGALPPALIAFEGHVYPIDPSWHVAGLGHRSPEFRRELVDSAAVIHFSGPAKPWLGIGFPELRSLWTRHVNYSNKFIRKCSITR